MNIEQNESPVQASSESNRTGILHRKISRRALLKGMVPAALGTAALLSPLSRAGEGQDEIPLLPDVLSDEELGQFGISIHNTPETELYIRKSAFEEFDIFRDAKDGRTKGVVITLVDDDSLSWDAMGRIPDEFLKTLGQAIAQDPVKFVEENYESLIESYQVQIDTSRSAYQANLSDLYDLDQGVLDERISETVNELEGQKQRAGVSELITKALDSQIQLLINRLIRIKSGEERELIVQAIEDDMARMQEAEEILAQIGTKTDAVKYYEKDSPVLGMIGRPENGINFSNEERFTPRQKELGEKLDQMDPGWKDKIFLFVSVGGKLTPKPDQSYPQRDWYKIHKNSSFGFLPIPLASQIPIPGQYLVDMSDPQLRGGASFVLRHELGHYEPEENLHDERKTDLKALDSLAQASVRYQEMGDDRGYPFIFKNSHGLTYAQKTKISVENPQT